MKKIIFFILLSNFCFAQEYAMSPFYGENLKPYYKYIPRQMTYYDIASVVWNNDHLLEELGLSQLNVKDNLSSDLKSGNFIYTYTSGAGKDIYHLYFKYNVINYNNKLLVKSVEISGSFSLITKFFIYVWPTKVQEGDLKKNILVKKYAMMDDMIYQYHNGKPTILISNRSFKNLNDFIVYRENSKTEYLKNYKAPDTIPAKSYAEMYKEEIRFDSIKRIQKKAQLDKFKQGLNKN